MLTDIFAGHITECFIVQGQFFFFAGKEEAYFGSCTLLHVEDSHRTLAAGLAALNTPEYLGIVLCLNQGPPVSPLLGSHQLPALPEVPALLHLQ